MFRPSGYVLITGDQPTIERDTIQCEHCGGVIEVKPGTWGQVYLISDLSYPNGYREEPGAYCAKCYRPLCLACEAKRICTPWEAQLDRLERRR